MGEAPLPSAGGRASPASRDGKGARAVHRAGSDEGALGHGNFRSLQPVYQRFGSPGGDSEGDCERKGRRGMKGKGMEEGLTFDDVILLPAESKILPKDVDVSVSITPEVRLNIPLLSAAMDTVTQADTAIAIAREGGLGVIHRNNTAEEQALEVDRVKKSERGMISDPITMGPRQKVAEALEVMERYRISGLPITTEGKLVGILTNRDLRFETNFLQPIENVMTKDRLVTVPVGTTLEQAKEILHKNRIEKLLVVDKHNNLRGLITIKDILKIKKYPFACKDGKGRLRVGAGVGPGSICITRVIAGVGVPQVYEIMKCAAVASKRKIPLIADGGIKYSGDITKALAAGASAAMIGSVFAGTDESPGEIVLYQGRSYKVYRGMGSLEAMKKGSKDRYFQAHVESEAKLVPEGIEGRVPYRGPLAAMIFQLVGGLKAGMGYVGARSIEDLQKRATFMKVTAAGLKEGHVHDVIITKEAPNYRVE